MKNRDIIMRRLEQTESNLEKMKHVLRNGGSYDEFYELINTIEENISDAKSFVQQEPLSPGEIN